jgi:hypothetical protein
VEIGRPVCGVAKSQEHFADAFGVDLKTSNLSGKFDSVTHLPSCLNTAVVTSHE